MHKRHQKNKDIILPGLKPVDYSIIQDHSVQSGSSLSQILATRKNNEEKKALQCPQTPET